MPEHDADQPSEPERTAKTAMPTRPADRPAPPDLDATGQALSGGTPSGSDARPGIDRPTEPPTERPMERPRVLRRRDPAEMTGEERAFLARHRADAPPHHDSAWG